jgi:hypothetical protein
MWITSLPAADGFGLRPFLLNGIEVRTVGREELNRMSPMFDGGNDVYSFVERCPVQDDDRIIRHDRQESLLHPTEEDVGVDVAVPEIYRQECERQDGTDGVQSAFGMPVPLPEASCSCTGISVRSRRIDRKPAFIEVHDRSSLNVFVPSYSRLKLQTLDHVSFGMVQSFFYS